MRIKSRPKRCQLPHQQRSFAATSVASRQDSLELKQDLAFPHCSTRWQCTAQAVQKSSSAAPSPSPASSHSLQPATGRVWAVGMEEQSDFALLLKSVFNRLVTAPQKIQGIFGTRQVLGGEKCAVKFLEAADRAWA